MMLLIMFLLDKAEKENSVIAHSSMAYLSVIFWKSFYSKASKGIMMEDRLELSSMYICKYSSGFHF